MRVLKQLEPLEPAYGAAIDEALFETARERAGHILRFWVNGPAVVIGRSQRLADEVDEAQATALGYDVVRRMTGGGAVIHDAGNLNITYVGPKQPGLRSVHEVFDTFGEVFRTALAEVGLAVDACDNSLFADGCKLSGAAQMHRGDTLLYHATLLRALPEVPMESLLLAHRPAYDPQSVASRPREVTALNRCLDHGPAIDVLIEAITVACAQRLDDGIAWDTLRPEEANRAASLADARYRRDAWTRCL